MGSSSNVIPREGPDLRWQSIEASGMRGRCCRRPVGLFWWDPERASSSNSIQTGRKSLVSRIPGIPVQMTLAIINCQDTANRAPSCRRRCKTRTFAAIMVLLCMTPLVVQAITKARDVAEDELTELCLPGDPSLAELAIGNPISHGQLIGIAKLLRKYADKATTKDEDGQTISYSLDSLLRGSKFYTPPPPPKKEPVSFNLSSRSEKSLTITTDTRIQSPHGTTPKRRRSKSIRANA